MQVKEKPAVWFPVCNSAKYYFYQ